MRRRRFLIGAGALVATGACSSGRKIPDLPELKSASRARTRWSVDLDGAGYGFTPAFAEGRLYAASRSGELVRVHADGGHVDWRVDAEVRLVTGVGAAPGLVAVAGRDGTLRMFDDAGKPRWKAGLGAEATSVPAVNSDVVVIRGSDNRVQAFDALTGSKRWAYTRQNPPLVLRQTAMMVLDATTVYVGLPAGLLIALSTETGALRWETALSLPQGSNEIERISDVLGAPALVGRDLCAGSFQGRVGCVDAVSGRPSWSQPLPVDGGVAFDGRLVVATDERGRIHAYSRTGEPRWTQSALEGRMLGAPALSGPNLLVGDEEGYVHWLSADDGRLVGRSETDGSPIRSAPVAAAGVMVAQTQNGRLYGLTAG